MPLDTFPLLQNHTRLIRYNDTLYKVKIIYDLTTLSNTQLDEQTAHCDIEQVFRAVLYKNERNDPLRPIVTSRFLVEPLKIPWRFPVERKNFKFTLYGKTLKVYEYLFEFHVSKNTVVNSYDDTRTSNKNVNQSVTKNETNKEKNACTEEEFDSEKRVEDSGVKRVLRYHRGNNGILFRESLRRGKSPLFGNKKVKKSFRGDEVELDVSTLAKDKSVAEDVNNSKSPVGNEHRASKQHLDAETMNETVTELFHDQKKSFRNLPKAKISGNMIQKKSSTPVTKCVKRNKFSLKITELKSLGAIQESRLRNRNRTQSGIVNQRSGRIQPRHTKRISERKPPARTRAKVLHNLKSNHSNKVSADEVERSDDDDEVNCSKSRITRNIDGRKHQNKNKMGEIVDRRRKRYSANNEIIEEVRRLRSLNIAPNHEHLLANNSEDSNSEIESSVCSDAELENRKKSTVLEAVDLRKKPVLSSDSECSPKKPRLDEICESEGTSKKSSQSRRVKLYALRNMLESGAGVMEIVSPRVSTVRPFKRKTPVKSAQIDQNKNVSNMSPRVTRKSLQDSELHKSEMTRNQMRSKAYTDMMLTIVKDGNKTNQENTEHKKEPPVIEPTNYRRSPRHQTDKFSAQRHSPRLAAAEKKKRRRSSGLWGKIMDTFVNPTTSFMFGNQK